MVFGLLDILLNCKGSPHILGINIFGNIYMTISPSLLIAIPFSYWCTWRVHVVILVIEIYHFFSFLGNKGIGFIWSCVCSLCLTKDYKDCILCFLLGFTESTFFLHWGLGLISKFCVCIIWGRCRGCVLLHGYLMDQTS